MVTTSARALFRCMVTSFWKRDRVNCSHIRKIFLVGRLSDAAWHGSVNARARRRAVNPAQLPPSRSLLRARASYACHSLRGLVLRAKTENSEVFPCSSARLAWPCDCSCKAALRARQHCCWQPTHFGRSVCRDDGPTRSLKQAKAETPPQRD
jgi:hypothetical protein